MGRRGVRERLQRQAGRCDRGVGNREADPGSHRGASEGGSDAGLHSAVKPRQRSASRSEGGRGFRQAQQAGENRPAGIYAQSELVRSYIAHTGALAAEQDRAGGCVSNHVIFPTNISSDAEALKVSEKRIVSGNVEIRSRSISRRVARGLLRKSAPASTGASKA